MSPSERLKHNLTSYWSRLADEGWPPAVYKSRLEAAFLFGAPRPGLPHGVGLVSIIENLPAVPSFEGMTTADLEGIAKFHGIVKNYLKMKKIEKL